MTPEEQLQLWYERNKEFFGTPYVQGGDPEYWRTRTPQERMQALEFMRQKVYGYDPETTRMVKVIELFRRDLKPDKLEKVSEP